MVQAAELEVLPMPTSPVPIILYPLSYACFASEMPIAIAFSAVSRVIALSAAKFRVPSISLKSMRFGLSTLPITPISTACKSTFAARHSTLIPQFCPLA